MKKLLCTLFIVVGGTAYSAEITRGDLISSALANNPQHRAVTYDSDAAKYNYYGSFSDYLPSVSLSYSESDSITGDKDKTKTAAVDGSVNLFRGFKVYNSMRIEGERYSNAVKTEQLSRLKTIRSVNIAYEAVIQAEYLRVSSRSLYEAAKLVLAEAEERLRLDMVTKADVYKAAADKERAYTVYLDAEISYKSALLELERVTLVQITGNELKSDPRVFHLESLDKYMEMALSNNIELSQAESSSKIAGRSVYVSAGSFLPSVDAFSSSTWTDRDSVDGHNSNSIGFRVSWNIFNGFYDTANTISKHKSASAARLTLVDARSTLVKNVTVLWEQAKTMNEKVKSAELYVEAANESYVSTQEMFRLGRATLKDVVDARGTLEDAQSTLAKTRYSMVETYEDLNIATGGAFEER